MIGRGSAHRAAFTEPSGKNKCKRCAVQPRDGKRVEGAVPGPEPAPTEEGKPEAREGDAMGPVNFQYEDVYSASERELLSELKDLSLG